MADDQMSQTDAQTIIEKFGGIRPMAAKLGAPVTTVQGWKKRNAIPDNRMDEIRAAAKEHGIDLGEGDEAAPTGPAQGESARMTPPSGSFSSVPHVEKTTAEKPAVTKPESSFGAQAERRETAARTPDPSQQQNAQYLTEADIMARINKAKKEAVSKSTLWSMILLILVTLVIAFTLLPTQTSVREQGQRLSEAERELMRLKQGAPAQAEPERRGLLPQGWQQEIDKLKEETARLKEEIGTVREEATTLIKGVTGENAGPLSERVKLVEQQIGQWTGNEDMTPMFQRVIALLQTAEGMNFLDAASQQLLGVTAVEQGADQPEGEVRTLTDRLKDIQQAGDGPLGQALTGVPQEDLKAAAMLIALSQFRSTLNRGEPFTEDLILMQNLFAKDDPELAASLERLAPQAASGVLSTKGLSGEFRGLAGEIVVASLSGEDVSLQERAKARLNNLMQVEKQGELVSGTPTQAIVAKAQSQLDAGDTSGALETLKQLEGDARKTALPFMSDLEAALTAGDLKTLLTDKLAGQMGALESGGNGGGMDSFANPLGSLGKMGEIAGGAGVNMPNFTEQDVRRIMREIESIAADAGATVPAKTRTRPIYMPYTTTPDQSSSPAPTQDEAQ